MIPDWTTDIKEAFDKIPDDVLFHYKDNIRFGLYPVRRGRLYDILVVSDGNKRLLVAVHLPGSFEYYAADDDHELVRDFLQRDDWKRFWCLKEAR